MSTLRAHISTSIAGWLKTASIAGACLVACTIALAPRANAQITDPGNLWGGGVEVKRAPSAAGNKNNTTVIEREGKTATGLKLVALLTADGQQIDQGLVWRIFQSGNGKSKLVMESRDASPQLKLQPGVYTVNAAFGRANLTRKITIKSEGVTSESFVLNAGGLRLQALIGGKRAPNGAITYSIFADDRDQFDSRTALMSGAKPNLIIRLNSGIYRIVSQYGDANARVETDVTVEAGKLTETTVTHTGGRVTFKLVTRSGGEAVPDTRWQVQSPDGETVKDSVGALPTHILAPGKYIVTASSGGNLYKKAFEVVDGSIASVEVLMAVRQDRPDAVSPAPSPAPSAAVAPGFDVQNVPSFNFKNQ